MSRKRSREQAELDGAEEALLLEGVSPDRNLFDLQVASQISGQSRWSAQWLSIMPSGARGP